MLLTAEAIVKLINAGSLCVVPRPDLTELKGASIDLRLGRWFLAVRQSKVPFIDVEIEKSSEASRANEARDDSEREIDFQPLGSGGQKRYFIPFDDKFILHPGRFILGITLEWITLPPKIAGYVTGKSSWGRRGLIIETAAGIHPGFSGCLALELANVGELPIKLTPGMPICQIFFHETTEGGVARSTFDGRRRPVLGKIVKDAVLAKLTAKKA